MTPQERVEAYKAYIKVLQDITRYFDAKLPNEAQYKLVDWRMPKTGELVANTNGEVWEINNTTKCKFPFPIVERVIRRKVVFEPKLNANGNPVVDHARCGDWFAEECSVTSNLQLWRACYQSMGRYPIYQLVEVEY